MLKWDATTRQYYNFVKVNGGISGRMIKVKKFDLMQPVVCLILTYLTHFQICFFFHWSTVLHSLNLANNSFVFTCRKGYCHPHKHCHGKRESWIMEWRYSKQRVLDHCPIHKKIHINKSLSRCERTGSCLFHKILCSLNRTLYWHDETNIKTKTVFIHHLQLAVQTFRTEIRTFYILFSLFQNFLLHVQDTKV